MKGNYFKKEGMINCIECNWEDIKFADREVFIGFGRMEFISEFDWSGCSDVVRGEVILWKSEWEGKKWGK